MKLRLQNSNKKQSNQFSLVLFTIGFIIASSFVSLGMHVIISKYWNVGLYFGIIIMSAALICKILSFFLWGWVAGDNKCI